MVEMKSGNTSVGHSAAVPEQGLQSVPERLTQMAGRDRRNRGDADGIDQVLSAVQEMLPQMPLLGLRAESGVAPAAEKPEKANKAGKTRPQAGVAHHPDPGIASGEPDAANKAAGQPQATMSPSTGFKDGDLPSDATMIAAVATAAKEISDVTHSSSSAQSTPQLMSDAASADGGTDDPVALQMFETSRLADAHRKEKGAFVGDEVQARSSSTESTQRDRSAGPARTPDPALRSRTDIVAAAVNAANAAATAPAGATQNGWVYSFRSWEGQHAVRVSQTPDMHNASLSSFASLALHPTSALVEQRLNAHGDMTGRNDQWVLQEYGEEGRQRQQDRRDQNSPQEEDES